VQLAGIAQAVLTQLWPIAAAALAALAGFAAACAGCLASCGGVQPAAHAAGKHAAAAGKHAGADLGAPRHHPSDLVLRRCVPLGSGGRVLLDVCLDASTVSLPANFSAEDSDPSEPLDDVGVRAGAQVMPNHMRRGERGWGGGGETC
jgi:hypothetical protein